MGFRFRRSIRLMPGLKMNISKRSIGFTAGGRGAHYTVNTRGRHTTAVGVPGTGMSYQRVSTPSTRRKAGRAAPVRSVGTSMAHARYCPACNRLVAAPAAGHPAVQFLLCIATIGLWLPVWALRSLAARSARCPACGGKTVRVGPHP